MSKQPPKSGAQAQPSQRQKTARPRLARPTPAPQAPRIALVGRPNVGKSTLFNQLVGRRLALVFDRPGVTRDRLEAGLAVADAEGAKPHAVWLADTAGLGTPDSETLEGLSQVQTLEGVEQAAYALLVVDGRLGLTPADKQAARVLRRSQCPFVVVVNKVDHGMPELAMAEFYGLGAEHVLATSAEHALGIEALRRFLGQALASRGLLTEATLLAPPARRPPVDAARAACKVSANDDQDGGKATQPPTGEDAFGAQGVLSGQHDVELAAGDGQRESTVEWHDASIAVAIVGRPNAGKSSLINAVLGAPRLVASPVAGTTRDAVDAECVVAGQAFTLIDTAGIRRKSNIKDRLEALSVSMALRSVERADVVVLLLNATERPSDQDAKIAALAVERGKGLIIAASQWDRIENPEWRANFAPAIRHDMPFIDFAPVVATSAVTKVGIAKLFRTVREVQQERYRRISTGALNRFFGRLIAARPPPFRHGKRASLSFVSQPLTCPPTIVVATKRGGTLPASYGRFLTNQLRARYGFAGTPLWIKFRAPSASCAKPA